MIVSVRCITPGPAALETHSADVVGLLHLKHIHKLSDE